MRYSKKYCQYPLVIIFALTSLMGCNSADNKKDNDPDTSRVAVADSNLVITQRDSLKRSFGAVVDSIYQNTPVKVFEALMAGHRRYAKNASFVSNSRDTIPDTLVKVKPYIVLTDIDLDRSVEEIFDLRRSMLIKLSSPACLTDLKQVAVMEYALNYSGAKVILVLSSSNSRMIGAAVDRVQTANSAQITNELSDAMKAAPEFADRSSANKNFVNNIAQSQARFTLEKIIQASPQIKMLADSGKVVLKSAFYDANKRAVTILDREAALINPSAKN